MPLESNDLNIRKTTGYVVANLQEQVLNKLYKPNLTISAEKVADVASVKDVNAMNAEIASAFTKIEVNVEGAHGYTAIAYNVYYMDYANPNDTANTYTVTI